MNSDKVMCWWAACLPGAPGARLPRKAAMIAPASPFTVSRVPRIGIARPWHSGIPPAQIHRRDRRIIGPVGEQRTLTSSDPCCAAWGANIGLGLTPAALAPDDQPDMRRERLPKVPVARLRSTVLVRARYWPVELPGRRGIGGHDVGEPNAGRY